MATLKDLRTRIDSVTQTQKITSAMKMVAASKLRRARAADESARPYADRMERMVGSLSEIMREREFCSGWSHLRNSTSRPVGAMTFSR